MAGNIKEVVNEQVEVAKKIQGKVKEEIKQVYEDIKEKKNLPESLEELEESESLDIIIVEDDIETEDAEDSTPEEDAK